MRFAFEDPFPEIPPAVLNIADIADYVAAVGIIYPFHHKEQLLKPASYEVALSGTCLYYDANRVRRSQDVHDGDEFVLPANSIAFVTLEPYFRLPTYLAMRFNLRITHVYRGLLLGTGPMVDPGFRGRLSLPLHNLTSNDYRLVGGEGLIWVEFTKLSPLVKPFESTEPKEARQGRMYYLEPDKARGLTVVDYLRKADPHRSIQSSIPLEVEKASNSAQAAERTVQRFGVYGAIVLFIAIGGIAFAMFQLITQVQSTANQTQATAAQVQTDVTRLRQSLCSLEIKTNQSPDPECSRP